MNRPHGGKLRQRLVTLREFGIVVVAAMMALVAGCNSIPPTQVHQPMTMRPAPRPLPDANNGAIFQPDNIRLALYEDRRARHIGDTLTIQINEKNVASKKGTTTASRVASDRTGVTTLFGVPGKSFQGLSVDASSNNKLEGKGESTANDAFTGTIAVTVIDVYPNGNLLVSGEKILGFGQGTEYLRFSGVVNPSNIDKSNAVSSTQVADARVEYRGTGIVDEVQVMGWLQRVFLSVLPF